MAFTGMDPAVVRDIGHRLKAQASDVGSIVATIDRLVRQSAGTWDGAKSRQFQDSWQSNYRPALYRAQQSLDGLGQSALNNASEQEQASSGGVSGSGLSPAAGGMTGGGIDVAGALAAAGALLGGVAIASGSSSVSGGLASELAGSGSWNGLAYQGKVAALLDGSAARSFTLDGSGISGQIGASGRAGVSADGSASYDAGPMALRGEAGAFAGVRGDAGANAGIGIDGAKAHLGGSAFVGAEGHATGQVEVGGVGAKGGVTGYAGIGAHFNADAAITPEKISLELGAGAALGFGGGANLSLEIDTLKIANDISKFLGF